MSSDLSTRRYPLLLEALRLLPDIGPRYERQRLGEAKYRAAHSSSFSVDFNGVTLKLAQLQELFICDEQGRPRVSPGGAKLLLRLYEQRAFVPLRERGFEGNLEVLARYAEGLASVVELNHWLRGPRKPVHRSEDAAQSSALPLRM